MLYYKALSAPRQGRSFRARSCLRLLLQIGRFGLFDPDRALRLGSGGSGSSTCSPKNRASAAASILGSAGSAKSETLLL